MREQTYRAGSLFGQFGIRKYLNATERRDFLESAQRLPPSERLFCLTLAWSGARISEILALTPASFDIGSGAVCIVTLKRRVAGVVRQVPLPLSLLRDLDLTFGLSRRQCDPERASEPIWRWSRTTAWRRVRAVMRAAGIKGAPGMPKGLRHGFGVHAIHSNVPVTLVQRWLGHASLRTTSIYLSVIGDDERVLAGRMWPRRLEPRHLSRVAARSFWTRLRRFLSASPPAA
jgi:integrase/recombinase XerD